MASAGTRALITMGFVCCMAMPAAAQKHVALVLDNGKTQGAPTSHASRIAEGLERMRYRVIVGRQQDPAGMRKYLDEFRAALRDAEVALFYYKGVALGQGNRNLLVGSNAAPGRPIEQLSVPLDEIANYMTASRANILLVDSGYADRTAEALARSGNGLSPAMTRLSRDRSRFMVAFANMPGKIGRSDAESPFAEVLASYLTSGDLTSEDLGRQLRHDVFERTRGSQLPWIRSDLEPIRLAALPEAPIPQLQPPLPQSFDRGDAVRAVQAELKRHQCYGGAVNGDPGQTHSGLEALGRTAAGGEGPEIQVASANLEEFEDWLQWSRRFQEPLCAPPAAAAPQPPVSRPQPPSSGRTPPKVVKPRPVPRVVERYERPASRPVPVQVPRSAPPSGGGGGGGFTFSPTR